MKTDKQIHEEAIARVLDTLADFRKDPKNRGLYLNLYTTLQEMPILNDELHDKYFAAYELCHGKIDFDAEISGKSCFEKHRSADELVLAVKTYNKEKTIDNLNRMSFHACKLYACHFA